MNAVQTFKDWFTRLSALKLQSQLILLLVLAVLLAQGLSVTLLSDERQETLHTVKRFQLLETLSNASKFLNTLTVEQQDQFLEAVNSGKIYGWLSDSPYFKPDRPMDRALNRKLKQLLGKQTFPHSIYTGKYWETELCAEAQAAGPIKPRKVEPHLKLTFRRLCNADFFSSIPLQNGRWLNTAINIYYTPQLINNTLLLSLGLAFLLIIAIVTWFISRLTRPLRKLAAAAQKSGKGDFNVRVEETGPFDLRQTIRSFNEMQERIKTFIESRTRLLASISHDLRTPITSMQLRIELLEHEEAPALLRTLKEMEYITKSSLDFFRESSLQEEIQPVDLSALVSSVCDDIAAIGSDLSYTDTAPIIYPCRANALKRVLTNLINNGITYGERVSVELSQTEDKVTISVIDQGQGIDAELQQQVFEPFFRADKARSSQDGNIGLGLSIVHSIVRSHDGEVSFNQGPKGFEVRLELPR